MKINNHTGKCINTNMYKKKKLTKLRNSQLIRCTGPTEECRWCDK